MGPDPLTARMLTIAVQILMLAVVGGAFLHLLLDEGSRRFWREAWAELLGRPAARDHIDDAVRN